MMENFSLANRYSNSLLKLGVVCRGCLHLGLDIKLADAKTCQDFLSEVAGLGMESYQNGFLCHSCVHRMRKMIAFRDSVIKVNEILSNIAKTKVTLQWLSETRMSLQGDTRSLSETVLVDCIPDDDHFADWDAVPADELEENPAIDMDLDEQKAILVEQNVQVESVTPKFSIEIKRLDVEVDNAAPSCSNAPDYQNNTEPDPDLGFSEVHKQESDHDEEIDHKGEIEFIEDFDPKDDFDDNDVFDHKDEPDSNTEDDNYSPSEPPITRSSGDEPITYHCQVCDSAIPNKEKYQAHVAAHKSTTPFKCHLCQSYFPSTSALDSHKVRHAMQFQCSLCEFKRRDKPQVMRHYAIKHIGLTYDLQCPECKEDLSERLLCLKSHSCLSKRVKCVNCDAEMDRIVLHQHEKQHRGEKMRYSCDECGKSFRHAIGVVEHKSKKHKKKSPPEENFYCVECDASYPSESSYKRHITYTVKHAREDLLKQCPECPTRLLKGALKRHILREHVREPPLQCELCQKRFFTKRGLIEHRDYKHYGVPRMSERKYTCETCGKAFVSKQFLTRHLNVHLGLKPFECKECGKRFPYDSGLYTHVLMVHRKLKRDSHGRFFKREHGEPTNTRISLKSARTSVVVEDNV